MQSFVSDTLYHFVGRRRPDADQENFEILSDILRSMELRTCEVDGARGGTRMLHDPNRTLINGEPAEQSVVCLCDIPRDDLAFHAMRYGRFGVGVSRSLVAQAGARPVIYIPCSDIPRFGKIYGNWGRKFAGRVRQVLGGLERFFPNTPPVRSVGLPAVDAQEAVDEATTLIERDFQAFLKFWEVDLPEDHPENYYMEREWRTFGNLGLAPCLREIVAPSEFHDDLRAIIAGHWVSQNFLIDGPICYTSC